MNNDFNSRVDLYRYGNLNNIGFNYRLTPYSYVPSRERTYQNTDDNWWDTLSSMMQSNHSTSITSLSDDNREDEKEIEILQEASKITDQSLQELKEMEDFYDGQYKDALGRGDSALAAYYRSQSQEYMLLRAQKENTLNKANEIVNKDKSLFTLSGHNPIMEAIGEMIDYTSTGAAIGSTAGGVVGAHAGGIGAIPGTVGGAILGAIGGAIYGGIDYITSGRNKIDSSSYEQPLSEDRNVNYANAIKTRQSYKDFRSNQIQDEQEDLLWWQTKMPVSDYYRYMESSGKGNYIYYNMPGIIGSSFSDTKDMGQQMIGSYGLNRLAKVIPTGKWGVRALAFAEALKNGWQASLNENHAEASETATKKALDEIKKDKSLSNEMVAEARKTAIDLYGLTDNEAKELIGAEEAFTMFQGNIGGLDPRKLENGYEFYKNARKLGDNGADTQFERDMMATASGDVLEAALMVTPYSAWAKKSKLLGRAVAGAAIGGAAGSFAGFGIGGSIIGGVAGGAIAQIPFARSLWRKTMKSVQAIEDDILPRLERQVVADKVLHTAKSFGITAFAEAAEEGTQYINAKDAEKILSQADDDLNLRNMSNLFVNDLKKRGQVFKAVLSQFGLAESPYQDDAEFWANYKGGLFLGGIMTGATTFLSEAVGAKKAYQAAKFLQDEILSSAVANRVESQDAILKGAAFAKYGINGNIDQILDIINRAKEKNKNRQDTVYTDDDFDELANQAARIISYAEYGPVRNRLQDLGYKIGSDEASNAIAIWDYYKQQVKENRLEGREKQALITKLMNDPRFIGALNNVTGEEILNDEEVVGTSESNKDSFKIRRRMPDDTVVEEEISNRERLKRLHQQAAELIAVTQLLKDLDDAQTLTEYAKSKGIAFKDDQARRSITSLKDMRDKLKNDVEIYSQTLFNSSTSYDQQIEYLKTLLLDQESGAELIDAYRDATLLMLNNNVYSNIVRTIGLDTEVGTDFKEAGRKSRDLVKMFTDHIKNNQKLQEIIDYSVEHKFEERSQNWQEEEATGAPDIEDPGFDNMSSDEIVDFLTGSGELDKASIDKFVQEKMENALYERDRASRKIFGKRKARRWQEQYKKWSDVDARFNPERYYILDESVDEDESEVETPEIEPEIINEGSEAEQTDDSPIIEGNTITWNFTPQQSSAAEVQSEEEENPANVEPETPKENLQQKSIDNLKAPVVNGPRKLMPGWYITPDGKIIPSERMYMANPVEAKKGAKDKKGNLLSDKYLRTAGGIRFNIHRILSQKKKADSYKLLKIKEQVTNYLGTSDVAIVDPVANAILKGDENAIKLLIMHANPRAWTSYYVNEFFRDAFRRVLNGLPVQRPDFIDSKEYERFFRKVIQYKRVMESRYGWKFVTNPTPSTTIVNGQEVTADPDFLAVDEAGNIHIINVHTMKVDDYKIWGGKELSFENTKSSFSIMAERTAYVDLQMKALQSKNGVQISSAVLLPVCVNGYEKINRLELDKMIPVSPSEEAVTKYANQEDKLDELKALLKSANEKAKAWTDYVNGKIDEIREARKNNKTKGKKLKKRPKFVAEEEPKTIAEAYAQLDKILKLVQSIENYNNSTIKKELEEIDKEDRKNSAEEKKTELTEKIEYINSLPDETKTEGIQIELLDDDKIINNSDLLSNGTIYVRLNTTPNGTSYISYELQYKNETYKIRIKKRKDNEGTPAYGIKNNGRYSQTTHPNYTQKIKLIEQLLKEHPEVVVAVDLKRQFTVYAEKPTGIKPIALNEPDSIISLADIDNLGTQQNDGRTVSIGFYDSKTGVIQTGEQSVTSTIGKAPEGSWHQNQLFLVIKQKHSEKNEAPERRVSIPLIKSKFNKNIANFIAQCYRVIILTNNTVDDSNQNRRNLANQMLHLFIGQRLVSKQGTQEYPNIVYMNGDGVRLNGTQYFLRKDEDFAKFATELQKCEIMPKWDTFNVKFRNLANSTFSELYNHFSTSNEDFKIAIDGVDSGLRITKEQFNNDTLCQWLTRNSFFATRWFIQQKAALSIHNLTVGGKTQQQVKEDVKKPATPLPKQKPAQDQSEPSEDEEEMSEEEYQKWLKENGGVEVSDDDEDEDDEYGTFIAFENEEYERISRVKTTQDAFDLIKTQYKGLHKLLKAAARRIGMPDITFILSDEVGPQKEINGVIRTKRGTAHAKSDGTWEITIYRGSDNPIKTLAHELVHVFTLGAINQNTNFAQAAKAFYSSCLDTFTKEEKQMYAFKNFKEFVAEFFTNKEFQDLLKSKGPVHPKILERINQLTEESKKQKNLFQSVIQWISSIWYKFRPKEITSYSQIVDVMENLLTDSYVYAGKEESLGSEERITMRDIMNSVVDEIKNRIQARRNNFSYTNHVTGRTVTFDNISSAADLRSAVDGIMTAWIKYNSEVRNKDGVVVRRVFLGENIDKLKFSTKDVIKRLEQDEKFAQWWYDTFESSDKPIVRELTTLVHVTDDKLKSPSNPDGYVRYVEKVKRKKRVNGVMRTAMVDETFYKLDLPKWDAVTPIIDAFMSDMRMETRKKVERRNQDEEIEQREDGRNTFGELLTETYQLDPFDRASREVKWLFSTVPYGELIGEGIDGEFKETTDHNKYGMNTFMPFKQVYGKVLYYTAGCKTTQEVLNKFATLAKTGPDKAMFKYLYDQMKEMEKNIWRENPEDVKGKSKKITKDGKTFDANAECTLIKVMRALRQQQNNFEWAYVEDTTTEYGDKAKDISIQTTIYQKGAIMAISSWRDQLATGLSGLLKYNTKTETYEFQNKKDGNVFKKVYQDLFEGKESFLYAYDKLRDQNPEDIVVHWRYLDKDGVRFSDITEDDLKTYIHNALLEFGVDVREEVIDQWINQVKENNPTTESRMDALYLLLSDQSTKTRPQNFFSRLAADGPITGDTITNAFNSGFIKQLANLQNEYDLKTRGQMTVAAHGNQYYIVSESNYVNDIKDILNRNDENDEYIKMLKEDAFAQGSVIVEMMAEGEKIDLDVATFVGMKTKNPGDQGRDYFEIELDEDVISKFELLHEGYMISPTQSDKKTYHTLKGIPLVGMLFGKRSNTDCYGADLKNGLVSIHDKKLLDRFIKYFESEKNAVEKAIVAYENKFYEKNPGKKIANYSDGNGMRFSSFNCIPRENGEPIYLNKVLKSRVTEDGKVEYCWQKGDSVVWSYNGLNDKGESLSKLGYDKVKENPRDSLNLAYKYFFGDHITDDQRREIMSKILMERAAEDLKTAEELGLIRKNADGLYDNVGLDGQTILDMATNIGESIFGKPNHPFSLKKNPQSKSNEWGPNSAACISAAIQQYVLDCSIKHMMSMQEYQRLFSGSKSFYKWKNNGTHVTDISVDYTKRRGGDISTGGVNIYDLDPLDGMEELGTYRCIEMKDYEVESTTLAVDALTEQFERSELASIAAVIESGKESSQMDLTNAQLPRTSDLYDNKERAEAVVTGKYGEGFVKMLKEKAKANAMQYFKKEGSTKNPVNVADGATYITDRMCEKLLRQEGKWDDKMKYAFEVLRGEHGTDVMAKEGQKLYKAVLNVVIGTQKYTATGFRKSDDGSGGTLMTPYYNKTALFPIFDQIAYGKMAQIQEAMRKNNVDMLMLTSAVKVGSQGAITLDQLLSDQKFEDHTYIQEMRFLRKQLNTDPSEEEEMNLGTQTIKIALSNLRMNDDYINPFTGETVKGRELYETIMRAYNILTDIGFEQVMQTFGKKDANGNIIYDRFNHSSGDYAKIPQIDEKALSDFLHEELTSRDANDNIFDAIAYDKENDRLAAPVSAISQSGWIDSILTSYINKTIIDTKSPGDPFIQRSVLGMEGDGAKMLNGGKDLQMINEDGSMDAIVSIDFFKDVIPDYINKTFEEARDWLIKHKLVGDEAKTYTISYRIPTQAQSSINPLKFRDVLPVVRDTIVLPKEFTKLTGSDFDIDKLFLSRLFINPETIEDPEQMFEFPDKISTKEAKLDNLKKAYTNKLFQQYITLLMDKESTNSRFRPIDADTTLWEDVYKDLYPSEASPVQSMSQDTIAYQTRQKNNFVVGKVGIGPYALNNNNHIYTMLYGISIQRSMLKFGDIDMSSLCRDRDIYGNSILSWLSGGINAHVDIAKDPFVTSLNINKYTYNISNFLLRAGFGRNGLWFLNLPVIKELASRMNAMSGQYLKATSKSIFDAQKEELDKYKQELADAIPEEVKNREVEASGDFGEGVRVALGRSLTVSDVLLNKWGTYKDIKGSKNIDKKAAEKLANDFIDFCEEKTKQAFIRDMVQKVDPKDGADLSTKSALYRTAKKDKSDHVLDVFDTNAYNYIAVLVFEQINSNEAKLTSDLTKYTKIDTKKQGSTIADQIDFIGKYKNFVSKSQYKFGGNIAGMFGERDSSDLVGFDTALNFSRQGGSVIESEFEESEFMNFNGYEIPYGNPINSFIDNKTKKAVNAVMSILRNDSVESTYGFQLIWQRVKKDFGKSSLTDDGKSKLRSTILGAIKNMWVRNAMQKAGINPKSLFKDMEGSYSLAHELIRLKNKRVSYTDEKGKHFGTIQSKYKDNALLNILYDAHSHDDFRESDKLIEILDFIMVHVPYTDDSKASNEYIQAWRELYEDDITRDFAVKLMFYSLLTTNDAGGNNLFKYVPFEMLYDYGLFEAEREMINELKDLSLYFTEADESIQMQIDPLIQSIADRVESILVEDFDFSPTYRLEERVTKTARDTGESYTIDEKQYVGFGKVFGNTIVKDGKEENVDRIPYVFIPGRLYEGSDDLYRSLTLGDAERSYIRVLNPVANYENQQRYLIYKKIGEVQVNSGEVLPIYKLINSPMYRLGNHKVYNYENWIDITSSQIITAAGKYTLSSQYSINDLNEFVRKAVKQIESTNDYRKYSKTVTPFREAVEPLENLDKQIDKLHEESLNRDRIFDVRNNILPIYEGGKYMDEYLSRGKKRGQLQMLQNLMYSLKSSEFTEEEKVKISDMIATINEWRDRVKQLQPDKKQPNVQNDPKSYHMHSGGAHGADTEWNNTAEQYGMVKMSHYYHGSKPEGTIANTPISNADYEEGVTQVELADQTLRRLDKMDEKTRGFVINNYLARDYTQVKYSDAVFAIGTLKYGKVDGGTGWAVQMAIDSLKPVHIFNLDTEKWYTYDYDKRTWVIEDTPKLTKNFAGIGTRSIDPEIELKTAKQKRPVKYVGDAKRAAALKAMDDVFRNTFGDTKPQSKNPAEFNGKNNPPENFNGPKESQEVLESANTILSNKEILKLKPYTGSDTHPRIAVASEHSDPAFFANQIVDLFENDKPLVVKQEKWVPSGRKTNEGKDIYEKKVVETTYTADDFDALYIITKHDGLPMKKILQTKVPKLIHFSVTGMGATEWEPGVMKYQDMLKRIKHFIKMGLDPEMVTMRIDPIIPGVTPFEVIEDIVKKSSEMGIKTIKFSVMDWYRSTAPEVTKNTGYDYSKYYEPELDKDGNPQTYFWCPKDKDGRPIPGPDGKPQWSKHIVYKTHAKVEEQKKISDFLVSIKDKYGVTLQSCAEPLIQEGVEKVGCLSVPAINNMLGTHIEDKGVDNNKQRALCTCYGGKTDLMSYDQHCASVCWYCYAHHQGEKMLTYYNPDGTLKDNAWTRTGYEEESNDIIKTVQDNGKIRLSLPSHTEEKPRQIVLEPQGDNKYYVHIRVWDGDHLPGKISDEDKQKLFDALYNELPEGAEILLPKSGEGYYATRGTIAALQRLARDNRFTPSTKGIVKYEDKDGSIKEYEGTSFIKNGLDKLVPKEQTSELSVDPEYWSQKEGWSLDYFHKEVASKINQAWQIEYEFIPDVPNAEPTAGPSSYTYSDGTIVQTPFQLTVEQANALEKIEEFINDKSKTVLTVSGYAGTGKTSVMEIVAQRHKGFGGHHIIFTASTNKASSVLGSKVKKKGFESTTLDKYFGLMQSQREGAKFYNARETSTLPTEFKGSSRDIVIIDEASMISKEKYDIITQIAKQAGIKIIFLGDIAQLPPVGETVSPVFQNNDNLIQLTEVKRTGDNAILKEATNLRKDNGRFSYESEFNTKGEGVAFTANNTEIFKVIENYTPHLKEDPNFFKIVTGTNESVEFYNNMVRDILGYETPVPQEGEMVMGYDNWGGVYDRLLRKTVYKIINSEDYVITKVGETQTKTVRLTMNRYDFDAPSVQITYTPVTLKDSNGRTVTVPYTLYEQNAQALSDIADMIQELNLKKAQAARSKEKAALRSYLEMINALKGEVMCDRDVLDKYGNTILKKAVDFGYAITAYKSQGSTYKNVIIDKNNIDKVSGWDNDTKQKMYYTAVSRATTTATVLTRDTKVEGNPIDNQVGKTAEQTKGEASMHFEYGQFKRPEVTSDNTFDAVINGERTATTGFEGQPGLDWWKSLNEGDIITLRSTKDKNDVNARRIKVRITKAAHKLAKDGVDSSAAPKTINVSSYGDYANLSNFAIRPFKVTLIKGYNQFSVNSVEQAFQFYKAVFTYQHGNMTWQNLQDTWDIMSKENKGSELKKIGGKLPMSKSTLYEWNQKIIEKDKNGFEWTMSDKVLYRLMKLSFEQDETAKKALLETGNAKITHNFNNGNPIDSSKPKRFGYFLEKIRSDIREQEQLKNNCK